MFTSLSLALAAAAPVASAADKAAAPALPKTTATLSPQVLQQLLHPAYHQTVIAERLPWLTHGFAFLFIAAAALLVVLLAFQTTKQEGLTGTIGGRVESAYRPRLGFDQQLARITGFVAIAFVIFATLVSLTGI